MSVIGTKLGSFQVTLAEAEPKEYAVESPTPLPAAPQPQIGSASVRAMKGNTGIIYVGAKGVTKTNGYDLASGDVVIVDVLGLAEMFATATKAGDKLCVFWIGP